MCKRLLLLIFFIGCVTYITAQKTEQLYLSGKGLGNTVTWDFHVSAGMNSGQWSQIEVPSQWELQGFGEYTYGRWYTIQGVEPSKEVGTYRHSFRVPDNWRGKNISIIFEGVMTDTEVWINGRSAGPKHQGGFYRFSYDITDRVVFGRENQLEVRVSKHSENQSVNAAERMADWWLFGGIYRPVFLEALPRRAFTHVAVDARGDGTLNAHLEISELGRGFSVTASITPLTGSGSFESQTVRLTDRVANQKISLKWDNIIQWNPENPQLYTLKLQLLNARNEVVHVWEDRIGFRTVEFRRRDGIYVNGTKIVMKGVNRHSFHPEGGRTTNRQISLEDVLLKKEMNINAVRFHYPPDQHFLDMTDSLGLFVINELAGWQDAYDTEVGRPLVRSMIRRDVNHPSIIMWANGNEGGWNYDLDPLFAKYDPQRRHLIHPWADWNDIDTHHYPVFLTGVGRFNYGFRVFMPTEIAHGNYDQGHGAGLEDFWIRYIAHPLFAGMFLWDFSDNSVKRTDRGGMLCSDGWHGADGIVGPYREREGSVYTIREVWSPIQFRKLFITPSFNGEFMVSNTYLFTNLDQCRMEFRIYETPSPLLGGEQRQIAAGTVKLPALAPGETGRARMQLPDNFFSGDVLKIEAFDKHGKSIGNWTWTINYADDYLKKQTKALDLSGSASLAEQGNLVILSASGVSVAFDKTTGMIQKVENSAGEMPFNNGPVAVGMQMRYIDYNIRMEGNDAVFVARYLGSMDSIVWRMNPAGFLSMDAVMLNRRRGGAGFDAPVLDANVLNFGLSFSFPEEIVSGMRWKGRGPYRVWKNRIRGTNFGIWHKYYNNTITGESRDGSKLVYPEFKGYHANLHWATFESPSTPFTVYSATDRMFFRVFTPEEPAGKRDGRNTMPDFPQGDISFLLDIPAIRCFKAIHEQGPESQPGHIRINIGDVGIRMHLLFDFR